MNYFDQGGVLVFEPDEYMDLEFKKAALPAVHEHLESGGRHVLVDCSGVDLINSYGISALLSIYDRLDGTHGQLAFAGSFTPILENALEISGLTYFCRDQLYDDADDALAQLSAA